VKPKIIIACTDPPFLGIIAMALSKIKSMPYIYNCRDLYPDVAYGLGKLKQGNLAARLFEYLNRLSLRLADVVVCLGESMKTRIVAKRVAEERVKVISDWVDVVKIKPVAKNENPLRAKYGLQDKFVIMHSGNLGLSQEFDSILQAVAALESYSLSLVFVGDGAAKESLKDKVNTLGLKNTFFLPYFSGVELSLSLGLADLQLVLLKEGMAGAIVPSKVYAIMAAARPYLAITDKASEPAIIAERFACGLWVKPGDVTGAVERIRWSINHPDELQEMGKRARAAAQAVFNKEILVKEWFRLLETRL
jgi:glycosyltransferase involved in cell wall biosynthesis